MSSKFEILVVIPTYNNAGTLARVIEEVLQHGLPLLVVNDGSTDQTASILQNYNKVNQIHHKKNLGKGAALKSALLYALENKFRSILTIDADGQHQASDIPKFLSSEGINDNHIIIGVRDFNSNSIPRSSRFGRKFSNFWIWAETGYYLSDTQSGFRLYPVKQDLISSLRSKAYDFEIEILVRAIWQGVAIKEIPIQVFYPQPEDRVSHFRAFKDNARLTRIHSLLFTTSIFLRFFQLRWSLGRKKSKSERRGAGLMALIVRTFGIRLSYAIMIFPLIYFFITNRSSRQGIIQLYRNLNTKPSFARFFRSFQNYWMFGCTMVDRFAYEKVRITKPDYSKDMGFQPGCIYVGAHIGDWLISSRGLNHTRKIPVAIILDQSQTPEFLKRIKRTNLNITLIDPNLQGMGAMLEMHKIVKLGGCLCFLGDRSSEFDKTMVLPFLGKSAHFPVSPYKISRVLKAPVFFFYCTRTSSFGYPQYFVKAIRIYDGIEDIPVEDILDRYVRQLEKLVIQAPTQWFNFFNFWNTHNEEIVS